MIEVISRWFKKYFSDPEGVILAIMLIIGFAVIILWGDMLAPLLASIIIAYLLEGPVEVLERVGLPRLGAVMAGFLVFLVFLLFLVLGLFPVLSGQATQLVQELPNMVARGQEMLLRLPEAYPNFISEEQVRALMGAMRAGVTSLGQQALSLSLTTLSGLFAMLIYLVLVPVLVFFFLKDKAVILAWVTGLLPKERALMTKVWQEINEQIGNYVRGKFTEILIVGVVTYVVFLILGLNYAPLLAVLVGLSVIIPYIGAIGVTIPVVLIAFFQWGWDTQFVYVVVAYIVIQLLDGNVLVPWLFSEAVNLHPVAIIAAILIFGGLWGFWGIFFAIPLATLVKALISSWPRASVE